MVVGLIFYLIFFEIILLYYKYYKMTIARDYKVQLCKLLKEVDRMDLWRYTLNREDRPEEPSDFVEMLVQEHPTKKERPVRKIDENYNF